MSQPVLPLRDHLGVIVAERRLRLGRRGDVVVRIGLPQRSGPDWRCPYAISGLGDVIVADSHGVDSMQAIQLAFAWIRVALAPKANALVWLRRGHGLGFPRQVPEDLGQELEAAVERLIEGAATRRPRATARGKPRRTSLRRKRVREDRS